MHKYFGAIFIAIIMMPNIIYALKYKDGFFECVIPTLEGIWWQDDVEGVGYTNKFAFKWISVIYLPDFVTKENFDWAVKTAIQKEKIRLYISRTDMLMT